MQTPVSVRHGYNLKTMARLIYFHTVMEYEYQKIICFFRVDLVHLSSAQKLECPFSTCYSGLMLDKQWCCQQENRNKGEEREKLMFFERKTFQNVTIQSRRKFLSHQIKSEEKVSL